VGPGLDHQRAIVIFLVSNLFFTNGAAIEGYLCWLACPRQPVRWITFFGLCLLTAMFWTGLKGELKP
jgi:hypothetical protein